MGGRNGGFCVGSIVSVALFQSADILNLTDAFHLLKHVSVLQVSSHIYPLGSTPTIVLFRDGNFQ